MMNLFIATLEHKHGQNVYADITEQGLEAQIAEYCRDWWEVELDDRPIPSDNFDVVEKYFEIAEHEQLEYSTTACETPIEKVNAELLDACEKAVELFEYALNKFNWGQSALDAKAIQQLNEIPGIVKRAVNNAKA